MTDLLRQSQQGALDRPVGCPKPGWIGDKAKKLGYSDRDIYMMDYNILLEVVGMVIEGRFTILPLEQLPPGNFGEH